jgi:hyperosmotically inducible periplasmic protein
MRHVTRLLSFAAVVLLAVSGCGVMRGEKSAGTAIDDTTLTARVKSALAGDPAVAASRINVDVNEGRVTLSGTAKSAEEIKAAQAAAKKVPGVKAVDSQLRVAEADTDSRPPG